MVKLKRESEYSVERVEEAFNRPLGYINDWIKDVNPKEQSLYTVLAATRVGC